MPLLFLALFFFSCSPKHAPSSGLPDYSDMGAAEDAGKTPSK